MLSAHGDLGAYVPTGQTCSESMHAGISHSRRRRKGHEIGLPCIQARSRIIAS